MPYHLPVLQNPLINSVFNCPNPNNSNLKKLFAQIAHKKFILLVPSNDKLLNYEDLESGSLLRDLCYSFDFVASHILLIDQCISSDIKCTTSSTSQQIELSTLNGRKVLLRPQNRVLLTADGFSERLRIRILDVDMLTNFNDYLFGTENVPLIHIDKPLCGNIVKHENLISISDSNLNRRGRSSSEEKRVGNQAAFENLIRVYPDWMNRFSSLFSKYRHEASMTRPDEYLFHQIIEKTFEEMNNDDLFRSVQNLHDLLYKYVEVNLYDDVWIRVTTSFKSSEIDLEGLQNLSLHQLESNLYIKDFEKFRLIDVVAIEKSISLATNSFRRLNASCTYNEKSAVLIETLQNISHSNPKKDTDLSVSMTMDADSLLCLFFLVVCRTQVKNLESHLYYLQMFAPDDNVPKFGLLGYALSTLEAVMCHFEDLRRRGTLNALKGSCSLSKSLMESLLDGSKNLDDFSKYNECLRYRSERGESILSLCIIYGRNEELKKLLKMEDIFPLEDILEDENSDGCTLLVQALTHSNITAASLVIDIVLNSCTRDEKIGYFNRADSHQRTAAHYLTHEVDILKNIGIYIDWKHKDTNGQTPLFTIFRSYDQENYQEMVTASYGCVRKWYELSNTKFSFFDHEDRKGNTLLHIIKRSADVLLRNQDINVNAINMRGLTPLMVFSKYNRLENITMIIADQRTLIRKAQFPLYLTCFDYAKNPTVLHELAKKSAEESSLGFALVHSLKFENTKWILHLTVKEETSSAYQTVKMPIRILQSLFRTISKIYPMTFVPLEESFEIIANLNKMRIPVVGKLETEHMNNILTECLNTLIYVGELETKIILDESDLVLWIRSQNKHYSTDFIYQTTSKNMEPEETNVVQSFLRFNLAELTSLKTMLLVLKKLAIFTQLKASDVAEGYKLFSKNVKEYFGDTAIQNLSTSQGSLINRDSSTKTLVAEINFLYHCTDILFGNIQKILNDFIPKWWKLYSELIELHKQYSQNFPHLVKPSMPGDEDGIITKLLEGKRAKFERRLSESIMDCRRRLNEVGQKIRRAHEQLAEELSKYMDFKGKFLSEGVIKKWVREHIKILREQVMEMQKIQYRAQKETQT